MLSVAIVLGTAPALAGGSDGSTTQLGLSARPLLPKQRRPGMHRRLQPRSNVPPDDGRFERGQHAFYLELLGAGGLYSFNYEYRPIEHVAMRAGVAVFPVFDSTVWAVPLAITALWGRRKHFLELGGGVTVVADEGNELAFPFLPEVGYRYMPSDSRWLVRVMFTPWLSWDDSSFRLLPLGGFSLGATF